MHRCAVALAAAGAAVAATFVLAGAAGAGPVPTKIDLSTNAAVNAYLESIGVNPATTVIQRGINNYAGPRCPGLGWNCTTATAVVQIATAGGTNIYEGNPEFFANGAPPFPVPDSFVTASPPIGEPCTVVQTVPEEGQNHVRCFQRSTETPTAALRILVRQLNDDGDNFFQGHQQIRQRDGAMQTANEDVEITQTTVGGNNHLHMVSQIDQASQTSGAATQQQTAMFTFDNHPDHDEIQETVTGNNFGTLRQDLKQDGKASGPTATAQTQTANQFGDVDQSATGAASILSNGDGQGFSQFYAHQSKSQRLTGPGAQRQDDPGSCCGAGTQIGNKQQTFMKILQESDQHASQGAAASQDLNLFGSCQSSGTCEITHHGRNDEDSITARNEGGGLGEPTFLTTRCQSSEFVGEGSGFCDSEPVEPPSED